MYISYKYIIIELAYIFTNQFSFVFVIVIVVVDDDARDSCSLYLSLPSLVLNRLAYLICRFFLHNVCVLALFV